MTPTEKEFYAKAAQELSVQSRRVQHFVIGGIMLLAFIGAVGFLMFKSEMDAAAKKHAEQVTEDARLQKQFYETLKRTNDELGLNPPQSSTPDPIANAESQPVVADLTPADAGQVAPKPVTSGAATMGELPVGSDEYIKAQKDKGLVLWKGEWILPEDRELRRKTEDAAKIAAASKPKVQPTPQARPRNVPNAAGAQALIDSARRRDNTRKITLPGGQVIHEARDPNQAYNH